MVCLSLWRMSDVTSTPAPSHLAGVLGMLRRLLLAALLPQHAWHPCWGRPTSCQPGASAAVSRGWVHGVPTPHWLSWLQGPQWAAGATLKAFMDRSPSTSTPLAAKDTQLKYALPQSPVSPPPKAPEHQPVPSQFLQLGQARRARELDHVAVTWSLQPGLISMAVQHPQSFPNLHVHQLTPRVALPHCHSGRRPAPRCQPPEPHSSHHSEP